MNALSILLQIAGGIALWLVAGFGSNWLWSKILPRYFSIHDHEDVSMFAFMWPIMNLICLCLLIHTGITSGRAFLRKQWKAFRAPKVEKKKEKAAAKIRMCPALKLKKYEQLLTEIEKSHNRHYYHYIHDQVTEFARIKGGKPEVKLEFEVRADDPNIVYFGVNDWDAVPAEGQVAQAVRWDVVVPMPEPERHYDGVDMYIR